MPPRRQAATPGGGERWRCGGLQAGRLRRAQKGSRQGCALVQHAPSVCFPAAAATSPSAVAVFSATCCSCPSAVCAISWPPTASSSAPGAPCCWPGRASSSGGCSWPVCTSMAPRCARSRRQTGQAGADAGRWRSTQRLGRAQKAARPGSACAARRLAEQQTLQAPQTSLQESLLSCR